MVGTLERFEVTHGSFGQQFCTIDGRRYATFFDMTDRRLRGLQPGVTVEYESMEGPTVLCHSPQVSVDLPTAILVRVAKRVCA
jgi:hypothetical protein